MKTITPMTVLWALCLTLFTACSNNDDVATETNLLKVEKADFSFESEGGTGSLILNMDGATAQVGDDWLEATVSGTQVKLTARPNSSFESRSTFVELKHNAAGIQRVSVTQKGITAVVELSNYDFNYRGEEKAFVWKTNLEPTITGLPDWLTYRIENEQIVLKAAAADPAGDSRTAEVTFAVGLYEKTITFNQVIPPLPYAAVLGAYTMEYQTRVNRTRTTIDVEFVMAEDGKTFFLKGLANDRILVSFDEANSRITIPSQFIKGTQGEDIAVAAFSAGFESGNDWGLEWGDGFEMVSQWNNDKTNVVLTMQPGEKTWKSGGNLCRANGFILWNPETGEYTGYPISRFCKMVFTKK